jgi:hypothetical protein
MEQDNRREKYQQMRQLLNEKQWRQFLALEAKERGNIVMVAREAGVSKIPLKREGKSWRQASSILQESGCEGKAEGEKSRRSTILVCRPIWKRCWSPNMSTLIVIAYPEEHRAVEVLTTLKQLRSEDLIDLDDAFYVTKDKEGDTKVHHSVHLTSFICTIRLQLTQRYFSRFILLKKSHYIINGLNNLFAGRSIRCLKAIKKLAEDS